MLFKLFGLKCPGAGDRNLSPLDLCDTIPPPPHGAFRMPTALEAWAQRRFESAATGGRGGGFAFEGLGLGDFQYRVSVGERERGDVRPIPQPAPEIFPSVVLQPPTTTTELPGSQDFGDEPVVRAPVVIDPGEAVSETVFENVFTTDEFDPLPRSIIPEWIPAEPRRGVADPVPNDVIVPVIYPTSEEPPAMDWGDFFGNVLGGIAGGIFDPVGMGSGVSQLVAGGAAPNYAAITAPTPRTVTVDTVTGRVTSCKRRRRRRLLTSSDLSDLASLKAIVGGGAAMNAAVVKAVRR